MASLGDRSVTEVVATVVQAGLLVLRQGGVGGSSEGVSCLFAGGARRTHIVE